MPRKATEDGAKLAPLNIRTTQERRQKLEAAAMASGRSLTQQVERYLEMAMNIEERLGGEELFEAMTLIGEAASHVLSNSRGELSDYRTRARVVAAIASTAEWAVPTHGLYETGDLKEIADAVEELHQVLPHIVEGFDVVPLQQLLNGVPLNDWHLNLYKNGIAEAELRYHNNPDVMSVLASARAALINAQDRAHIVSNSVHEQARAGRLDAFAVFARGQQDK